MRLLPHDIGRYPKFAAFLSVDLIRHAKTFNHGDIIPAMQKAAGGVDQATILGVLAWNADPQVIVEPDRSTKTDIKYGSYDPVTDTIYIVDREVKSLESGWGLVGTPYGEVFVVAVILLHELIHWADDRDGIIAAHGNRATDPTYEFERNIYGKVIS